MNPGTAVNSSFPAFYKHKDEPHKYLCVFRKMGPGVNSS